MNSMPEGQVNEALRRAQEAADQEAHEDQKLNQEIKALSQEERARVEADVAKHNAEVARLKALEQEQIADLRQKCAEIAQEDGEVIHKTVVLPRDGLKKPSTTANVAAFTTVFGSMGLKKLGQKFLHASDSIFAKIGMWAKKMDEQGQKEMGPFAFMVKPFNWIEPTLNLLSRGTLRETLKTTLGEKAKKAREEADKEEAKRAAEEKKKKEDDDYFKKLDLTPKQVKALKDKTDKEEKEEKERKEKGEGESKAPPAEAKPKEEEKEAA